MTELVYLVKLCITVSIDEQLFSEPGLYPHFRLYKSVKLQFNYNNMVLQCVINCNFGQLWIYFDVNIFLVNMKIEAQKYHNKRNKIWEQAMFGCLGLLGVT